MSAFSQKSGLPNVDVYTLEGRSISAEIINNDGKPLLVVFWKTNDKDCLEQISMFNEIYNDSLKTKGVKFVAICVNCTGNLYHIKPFVYGHDFNFEVYVDKNGDLKRAMAVPELPFTILFDQNMKVFSQHIGYCRGDENLICSIVDKCLEMRGQQDDLVEYTNPELKVKDD